MAAETDDEWFKYYIKVDGQRVTARTDEQTVVEFVEPEGKERTVTLSSGTFARQAHDLGSTVLLRNIRVQRLP